MRKMRESVRILLIRRTWWSAAACLCLAAVMFYVVNYPAAIGAAAAARQLPIYCVQRDQKLVSISFDAAWGDVRQRRRSSEAGTLGKAASPLFRESKHAGGTRFHAEKSSRLA